MSDDLITVEFSPCLLNPHEGRDNITLPQLAAGRPVQERIRAWRQRQREELEWLVEHVGYAGFVPSADDLGWRFVNLADATLFRLTFPDDRLP